MQARCASHLTVGKIGNATVKWQVDSSATWQWHYFLDAAVNDKTLTLLVDTGASGVALPMEFAQSAKIVCRNKIYMQTANGVSEACTTIIPKLTFGPFTLIDTPALLSKNLGQPLLGMNVLQQFKVEQNNGEMRISTR